MGARNGTDFGKTNRTRYGTVSFSICHEFTQCISFFNSFHSTPQLTPLLRPLQRPVLQHRGTRDAASSNHTINLIRLHITPARHTHRHDEDDGHVLLVAVAEHRVRGSLLLVLVPLIPLAVPHHRVRRRHIPHQSVLEKHLEALSSLPNPFPTCHACDSDSFASW